MSKGENREPKDARAWLILGNSLHNKWPRSLICGRPARWRQQSPDHHYGECRSPPLWPRKPVEFAVTCSGAGEGCTAGRRAAAIQCVCNWKLCGNICPCTTPPRIIYIIVIMIIIKTNGRTGGRKDLQGWTWWVYRVGVRRKT